jgi:hypothetical protein
MSRRTRTKEPPPKYRVGDWVRWGIGNGKLAVVIEDCGPVGLRARRFYRLREYALWTPPQEYELPEDSLQPAERPEKLPEPHDKIPVP